jgi:hypothetical protein
MVLILSDGADLLRQCCHGEGTLPAEERRLGNWLSSWSPMDGRCVTRGTRRFAGRFAKLRGRFAKLRGRFAVILQVSHRALHTYHTHFTAFRGVSQTFRECHASCHTRFAVFRGRFASVALDASMQPRCHNVGISAQHDSIKILNLKHSVTTVFS